jgi:DNA-binding NarL/FixJ family response regulator
MPSLAAERVVLIYAGWHGNARDQAEAMEHPDPARNPEYRLTERQRAVVCLLVNGLSPREIAERLCLSEHTVHEHIRQVCERLGVHNRAQLVVLAVRSRLCDPDK